jgi:hypothetical protein
MKTERDEPGHRFPGPIFLLAQRQRRGGLSRVVGSDVRSWSCCHCFCQEGKRHGKDLSIGLEDGAVVTTCGEPSTARVDDRHGSAEMDRGAVPAAFGYEILDERAIVLYGPPLLTEFQAHPVVAE